MRTQTLSTSIEEVTAGDIKEMRIDIPEGVDPIEHFNAMNADARVAKRAGQAVGRLLPYLASDKAQRDLANATSLHKPVRAMVQSIYKEDYKTSASKDTTPEFARDLCGDIDTMVESVDEICDSVSTMVRNAILNLGKAASNESKVGGSDWTPLHFAAAFLGARPTNRDLDRELFTTALRA